MLRDIIVRLTKPRLVRAAKRGDLNEVRRLLGKGINVDVRDRYGRTALMEASREGHIDVIKVLLEQGASLQRESFSGKNALNYATNNEVSGVLSAYMSNA